MIRVPVGSRRMVSVGWEAEREEDVRGVLEVEFRGGAVYRYRGVPKEVYEQLLFAESPGRFLEREVLTAFEGERL